MRQDGGGHRHSLKAIARRAMEARGLWPDFSAAVMTQLGGLAAPAAAGAASVRDLRERLWVSIDNDDSRDLDQLTVAAPLAGEATQLLVAIADVDALVEEGSAIDQHAAHNTTSVYTAAEIFSMLPEKLSTDLSSLGERADRLAIVIEMEIAADGSVAGSEIYRGMVRNQAKLAYRGVAAWLEGAGPAPARLLATSGLETQLRLQDAVAQRLKSRRHHRGALSLETVEARPVFAGDSLADLEVEHPNRATALIEDFMIAANGVTASYLAAKSFPSLRRVLRSPERWQRIVELASGLGDRLPSAPDAAALEGFLARRKRADPLRFPDLSLSVIKLMGKGEYVVDRPGESVPGHFGLAVAAYTHSTAPNRRFPDLLTQRLLKAALAGGPVPYAGEALDGLARRCTEREDDAHKVERQVRKSAAALLLESRIGQQFDGLVTGASQKGTWVRILTPPVEGKLVRGVEGLDVGDRLRVRLVATDVERGYIDFARAA